MDNDYDIKTISGDTFELNMIYRDSDKVPIDLTDYEVYFQVRTSQASTEIEFEKSFTISAEEGVEGTIKFALTAEETEALMISESISRYVYGMRLTSSDELNIKTLLSGTLEVIKGVI